MYLNKEKRSTLSDMVLAHRVAIRGVQQAERGTAAWYAACTRETVTQYAIELVLDGWTQHQWDYIQTEADDDNADAVVAIIRMEKMGVAV